MMIRPVSTVILPYRAASVGPPLASSVRSTRSHGHWPTDLGGRAGHRDRDWHTGLALASRTVTVTPGQWHCSDSDSEGEGLRTARAAGRPPEIRILKAGLYPAASEPPGTAGT